MYTRTTQHATSCASPAGYDPASDRGMKGTGSKLTGELARFSDITKSDIVLRVPHPPMRSGLTIHALRWAELCESLGLVPLIQFEGAQSPRARKPTVLVGLPNSSRQAQDALDTANAVPTACLWERIGFTVRDMTEGLEVPSTLIRVHPRPLAVNGMAVAHDMHVPTMVPDTFAQKGETPLNARSERGVFLGRYSRAKGAATAAAVWMSVNRQMQSGFPLYMLGRGLADSDEAALIEAAAQIYPEIVLDHLPTDDERADFLAGSRVALFLGTHDYYPQALLECLASGIIVVASDISGYAPAIRDGRALCPESTEELRSEIWEALTSPRTRHQEMANKAREYVASTHSAQVVRDSFAGMLNRLL